MTTSSYKTIDELPTPSLILDLDKMNHNIKRLSDHIGGLGGKLRPHVKTHKSIEVARKVIEGGNVGGITVSTLHEADYFFENGITDIMYAVGIAPNKFAHVADLMAKGCDLKVVLDSQEMARQIAQEGEKRGIAYKVLIELDTDGHRSGACPESDELLEIARTLHNSKGCELMGLMTHAGESYNCRTPESLLAMSRQERDRTVNAAKRFAEAGLPCPIVSIGSTPTAFGIDDLEGVTEVRAGVYTFFDLVMSGVGVCSPDDIAISVLASVIGYQKEKSWAITDGGWMAMSRDRGTANQDVDYGYGMVVGKDGQRIGDLKVIQANQEHGVIGDPDHDLPYDDLPMGGMVRILPNHACATSAQYSKYYVVKGSDVIGEWDRINGW